MIAADQSRAPRLDLATLPDSRALRQATLLAQYDPFALVDMERDEAGLALLMAVGQPLAHPPGLWSIPPANRLPLMARLTDRTEARALLADLDDLPTVPVQRGLCCLMAGPQAVADAMADLDADLLGGMVQAYGWLEAAPALAEGLPDAVTLARALADARRTAPLRQLVGTHFSGRDDVLDQLRTYIDGPPGQDILFLYGPGGIGKSTVLAKFALDARDSGLLDAVAYLNLDRAILRPEEPLTLLEDMLLQLRDQLPGGEALAPVTEDVSRLLQDLAADTPDTSLLESVATFSGGQAWEGVLDRVIAALDALPGDRALLVLIDTFEQAWNQGRVIVSEIWRLGMRLAREAPRLRIVAAGRVSEPGFTGNAVALAALDRDAVARILETALGHPADAALVAAVHQGTGGHPLTVRLAATAIAQAGPEAYATASDRAALLARLRDDGGAAFLDGRILDQIRDPLVRRLAVPGLAVRRVTVDLIRDVLALPCGLEPDASEDLFARLAAQADLVIRDPQDDAALLHRRDLRALMLPPLRARHAEAVARIDDGAVAFWADRDGPQARAEEIYHRLMRGDAPETLVASWQDAAAPLLADALPDLPEDARDWLATRLSQAGVAPHAADLAAEDQQGAALFLRILDGIHDPVQHALARYGTVLRRLDPGRAAHVLAPALGLALTEADAHAHLAALTRLTALVAEHDDTGFALFPDLRQALLPEVRATDPALTARIDAQAITYHAARATTPDRAEELYHRLMRGDPGDILDARWNRECGPLLAPSLAEMPLRAKAWLGGRLRTGAGTEAAAALDLADWEASAARLARQLLAKGVPQEALDLLRERDVRLPGSALYGLEAEILMALDRAPEAQRMLARGIASAEDEDDPHRLCELLLLDSLFRERRRAFADATGPALLALHLATEAGDDEYQLRALSALLRLDRKTRRHGGPSRAELTNRALDLVYSGDGPGSLRPLLLENTALARGLAAELGPAAMELLEFGMATGSRGGTALHRGSTSRALVDAVTERLARIEAGEIGALVTRAVKEGPEAVMRLVPDLMGLARDRNVLDAVARPLSWMLAAEIDQRIGAEPSRSMLERRTGLSLKDR